MDFVAKNARTHITITFPTWDVKNKQFLVSFGPDGKWTVKDVGTTAVTNPVDAERIASLVKNGCPIDMAKKIVEDGVLYKGRDYFLKTIPTTPIDLPKEQKEKATVPVKNEPAKRKLKRIPIKRDDTFEKMQKEFAAKKKACVVSADIIKEILNICKTIENSKDAKKDKMVRDIDMLLEKGLGNAVRKHLRKNGNIPESECVIENDPSIAAYEIYRLFANAEMASKDDRRCKIDCVQGVVHNLISIEPPVVPRSETLCAVDNWAEIFNVSREILPISEVVRGWRRFLARIPKEAREFIIAEIEIGGKEGRAKEWVLRIFGEW